jgi:pimeloyl-ACP methyl ester carboxylesterase
MRNDDGMSTTFVLVHGGGHGGWCWQRVARRLRAAGHDVYTPTLTGFGERSHLDTRTVTFETFVLDIVNVLEFEDLHDVVLVGHSMGGVIIPRVAERVPERISAVVWIAAVVTNDGESLLDTVPQSPAIAKAVRLGADGTAHTDPNLILDANMQDGTAEDKAMLRRLHTAYPPHALTEKGRLSSFLALGIPTAFITAADDLTIEAPVTAKMAARLPGARLAEVPGGHDCMITQPDAVAGALLEVVHR